MTRKHSNTNTSGHSSAKAVILDYLKAGKFESAFNKMTALHVELKSSDFDEVIAHLKEKAAHAFFREQIRNAKRYSRIIDTLQSLQRCGPDPTNIIAPVILPEGYHGKILLASVSGGIIENSVILRSGDLWHSEILRETQAEIRDLGLVNAEVHPLGGAWARFENDDTILIWGSSDQFGACDKEFAAELIRKAYPDRKISFK
jgi:hypothetical protein